MRLRRSAREAGLGLGVRGTQAGIVRLARSDDVLNVRLAGGCEARPRVRPVHCAELAHDGALDRLGIGVVTSLVVGSTAVLGRDGQAPPRLSPGAGDESEGEHGGEAADGEARPGAARSGATALERRMFSVQHSPGVVVRPGMVPGRRPGGRRRARAHRRSSRPEGKGRASAGALRLPKELRRKPAHRRIARTTNPSLRIPPQLSQDREHGRYTESHGRQSESRSTTTGDGVKG